MENKTLLSVEEECQKCKTVTDDYFTMYGELRSGGWVETRCKSCLIDFLQETDGYYLESLYSLSYSKDIFKDKLKK